MDGVIDLIVKRNKREQPDPEFVKRDDFGRPMYAFALEYQMDDKVWATEIWAYSFEDAEARVSAMKQSLVVCGQLHTTVPA